MPAEAGGRCARPARRQHCGTRRARPRRASTPSSTRRLPRRSIAAATGGCCTARAFLWAVPASSQRLAAPWSARWAMTAAAAAVAAAGRRSCARGRRARRCARAGRAVRCGSWTASCWTNAAQDAGTARRSTWSACACCCCRARTREPPLGARPALRHLLHLFSVALRGARASLAAAWWQVSSSARLRCTTQPSTPARAQCDCCSPQGRSAACAGPLLTYWRVAGARCSELVPPLFTPHPAQHPPAPHPPTHTPLVLFAGQRRGADGAAVRPHVSSTGVARGGGRPALARRCRGVN